MDRLEEEHDNLRAALEWSLCEECGSDLLLMGMRIAIAVSYFWLVRGYWSEAWDWMNDLLKAPKSSETKSTEKAQLLYSAGFLVKDLGDIHVSKDLFNQALIEAKEYQGSALAGFRAAGLGRDRFK